MGIWRTGTRVRSHARALLTRAPSNFGGSSSTTGSTIMKKNWSGELNNWYYLAE
jgi:hypothetical protein